MTSVINRMLEIADFKGVSANKLSEKIGVGNSYFSQQKKNNGSVGSDIMLHLCREYPDINPEWLLTGKGSMLRTDERAEYADPQPQGLPLIPHEAIAGYGSEIFDDGQIIEYLNIPELNKVADCYIPVKGSSMYPKYSNGDILALKLIKDILFFQWNKVYVVETESQGILVKRIKKGTTEESITCISENEKYEPFEIPKSDIRRLFLVVGAVKFE